MRKGSLCYIKSKKNSLQSYVVLYSDIDDVLNQRTKNNNWMPSILTSELCKTPKRSTMKSTTEPFILLDELKDENGGFYYKCLYGDIFGWIIGSKKQFELVEKG